MTAAADDLDTAGAAGEHGHLPVLLGHDIISDGQVARPEVGAELSVAVTFSERGPWPDELVTTFEATARWHAPARSLVRQSGTDPRIEPHTVWPSMLFGHRWRALWPARHEVPDGPVRVQGVMTGDYGALSGGRARGRVVRVRLVVAALAPAPESPTGWKAIPGRTTLRAVPKVPSRLDPDFEEPPEWAAVHRRPPEDGSPRIISYGAMVDLDLHEPPAAERLDAHRPRWRPT